MNKEKQLEQLSKLKHKILDNFYGIESSLGAVIDFIENGSDINPKCWKFISDSLSKINVALEDFKAKAK